VLSKESAAIFPLALLLWQMALDFKPISAQSLWTHLKSTWTIWGTLVIAGLGCLTVRFAALGYLYQPSAPSTIPSGD
jgi:hypothetical protein